MTTMTTTFHLIFRRRLFQVLLLLLPVLIQLSSDYSAQVQAQAQEDDDSFLKVNEILKNVTVKLPDLPTMKSNGYSIDLYTIICHQISMKDITVSSSRQSLDNQDSNQEVQIELNIKGLDFMCNAEYKYRGVLGMTNYGNVYIYSAQNDVTTTATVSSDSSNNLPSNIVMQDCTPTIQILDIDFSNGGFIGLILDAIEGILRTSIEDLASNNICTTIQTMFEQDGTEFLQYITNDILYPYLNNKPSDNDEPNNAAAIIVQYETDFVSQLLLDTTAAAAATTANAANTNTGLLSLLNLREQDTYTGRWMNELIQKGVDKSNEIIPTMINSNELQINSWLRDFVLDQDDRSLMLTDNFPNNNGILYKEEDLITNTVLVLDRVKLLGLDTITKFSPFNNANNIGNYTLETNLAWDYLALEIDMNITVRPSSHQDSILSSTSSTTTTTTTSGTTTSQQPIIIQEQVKLLLSVNELTAGASVLTAINRTSLENEIRIGSLLKSSSDAINCLLSTIIELDLISLNVDATDISTPFIMGLVSTGLDELIDDSLELVFLLYETILLDIAPTYIQNELRPQLSQKLLQEYVLLKFDNNDTTNDNVRSSGVSGNGRTCVDPWTTTTTTTTTTTKNKNDTIFIDYRDLFLSPEESMQLGGSGTAVYGDLLSTIIVPYINNELLSNVDNELNSQYIPSITKQQSGIENTIIFNDVWEYQQENMKQQQQQQQDIDQDQDQGQSSSLSSLLYDTIDLRISKIIISNLNTITGPVKLLQPTSSEGGNILSNRIAFDSSTSVTAAGSNTNVTTAADRERERERDQYLNITVRVFLNIDDIDDATSATATTTTSTTSTTKYAPQRPFRMKNEIDFSISLPSTSLSIDILMKLKEKSVLEFPFKDLMNPYCWLSALGDSNSDDGSDSSSNSDSDNNGGSNDDRKSKNLVITSLAFSLSTFFLHSTCINTDSILSSSNSPGCDSISEVLNHLVDDNNNNNTGLFVSSFRTSIIILIEDLILSLWNNSLLDELIKESPNYCPHISDVYNDDDVAVAREEKEEIDVPSLLVLLQKMMTTNLFSSGNNRMSSNSLETILALGIIGFQSSIIVSARNHLLLSSNDNDKHRQQQQQQQQFLPSDTTSSSIFSEGREGIIDFTNLNKQFGLSWIDIAFDEFREYLSRQIEVPTTAFITTDDEELTPTSNDDVLVTRKCLSSSINTTNSNNNNNNNNNMTTTSRVNILLREYILDDDGILEIDIEDMKYTTLGITMSVVKVRITGLDTITSIDPFVVVDPYTMSTSLKLNDLVIALDCNITNTMDGIGGGGASNIIMDHPQVIELVYKANGISLDVDTKIAINTTSIGQIKVGSLFDISKVINCMIIGLQEFEISKLDLNIEQIERPVVGEKGSSSFFSIERQSALSKILNSLHDEYQNEILQAIPLMTGSTIREVFNTLVPSILQLMTARCKSPPEFANDGVIDFRELLLQSEDDDSKKLLGGSGDGGVDGGGVDTSAYGNLFRVLYGILDKEVMQTGASKRPVMNDLLETLTMKQSNSSGTIKVTGTALDTQSVIQIAGLCADFGIQVSDVLIQNLNSVGDPLHLFRPVDGEAHILDNKLSFGVDSKPLQFQATLTLSLDDGDEMKIRNEIDVSFLIEDVTVQAEVLIKVLENSISNFPIEDFTNLNCWAATILPISDEGDVFEGVQLLDQSYYTGDFDMDIACTSCTSPDFDKLLLSLYEPQDITAAIKEQTNGLMDSEFAQTFLNDMVNESKKRCPHLREYDREYDSSDLTNSILLTDAAFSLISSEQKKNPKYFNVANSVIAGCLILIGILGKIIVARRNKKWMHSLTNEGRFFLDCQRDKQQSMEDWLDENTSSLFASPSIPKSIRWGVPFLLIVNVGLYLGGHLGLLSVINLDVTLAGQSFTIKNFLEFRFIESTKTTYDNGGAEMIILMWIFTGIWPYVKLLLSLVIWMVPPKYLGVKRRGTTLLWIDALARLSIIDIFTMILGFAILLVFIGGPDESIDSDGVYYALKAIVVPKFGCYCIIVAQRMSRVSSQFLLEYHDTAVTKATEIRKGVEGDTCISQVVDDQLLGGSCSFDIDPPSIRITDGDCMNTFENDLFNDTPRSGPVADSFSEIPTNLSILRMSSWKVYRWGHLGGILAAITIAIVFIIGCVFAPAIAFDISSIGGIAIESENTYEEAVSEYGVFLVISGILFKARFVCVTKADYIGLGLLLFAAGVSVSLTFVIKAYQFIQQNIRERKERQDTLANDGDDDETKPTFGHEGCGLPSYFRLYKCEHMEIYFISVCIGVWQLGSIVSYSIHLYCCILTGIFDILTSIGIAEPTEAQCNRIQASLPSSLLITLGSFLILVAVFYIQASGQYKKNFVQATKYVDDKDVPALSLAWSQDKSKNSRYSHLTESLALSADTISSRTGRTSFMSTPMDSSFSSRGSVSFRDSPARSSIFTTRSLSAISNGMSCIHLSSSEDTINEIPNEEEEEEDDEISVRTPVASLIVDVISERSSTIDAACELVATNSQVTRNATAASAAGTTNRPQAAYQNFRQPISLWERSNDNDHDEDNDDDEMFYPPSSSLPPSPPPMPIMASRSMEDSSSITSPKSPQRTQPSSPSVVASAGSSTRSPPPRFKSTYDFLHQMEGNSDQ